MLPEITSFAGQSFPVSMNEFQQISANIAIENISRIREYSKFPQNCRLAARKNRMEMLEFPPTPY